ncbi:MAG: substrate-binding domain-containing protein [Prevotella sp.]|nr:substrate-binding domain-containing protein [Prevotella sp.]
MKECIFKSVCVLAVAAVLASCSSGGVRYRIGVSQCSEDIWRNWQNQELKMEANFHEGVELRFTAALDDSKRQIQQIDSLVDSGIDLLIVAPNQLQSVTPAIDRAYDMGIPVIVFERKTGSQKYTAFVSADNYEMGRQMGLYIASRLNGKGRVMEIMGLKGSSPADERHKGFRDAIADFPKMEVVTTLQGDWTEGTAYDAVMNCHDSLGDIDFVFGHNDRTAIGARRAFMERNLPLPLFCGIDGLPGEHGGIRLVRDSLLDASYIYPTRGDYLLQLALKILEGEPYERETMLTSALVTRDNANVLLLESDEVMRQSEKLEMLQQKASDYLRRIDVQRLVIILAIALAVLLALLAVGVWFYNRQRVRIAKERGRMERERLDFYTRVSHELRTPLTLIEGPLEKLAMTTEVQQASFTTANLFAIVRRNTRQLTTLVNKMLNVQMKETSELKVEGSVTQELDGWNTIKKGEGKDESADQDIDTPTILVVDDNDDIRYYLRTILEGKYRFLEAADGQQGLDVAKEQVPDLVVSDVMMPVMNGLQFCQKLKGDMVTSHIPVILLTARALSKHQIEGYVSGADAYITKPFQPDLLLARIDNLLTNRRQLKNLWEGGTASQPTTVKDNAQPLSSEPPAMTDNEQTSEEPFVARFKKIVEQRMGESNLSVEDIASDMSLSRVQLYRKVKALTGSTPVDLLKKARLASARDILLTDDTLSVSEVAYRVGFSLPSYFTKCFKEEYGMVPGDVRKKRQ